MKEIDEDRIRHAKSLTGLRKYLIDRGGHNDLVIFLSGMGGTGKSEVIKAFVYFARNISIVLVGAMMRM